MSPSLSSTQALTRAWKGLGAPRSNGDALAMGPEGFELARAVRETLAPGQVVLLHPDPPPARARFTTATDLDQLLRERPASFDLAAASGGLETGDLAEVRDRLRHIADLLKPGGVLAAAIETLAAPDPDHGGYDLLLFPHLARSGELGEAMQARAPLPASAWRALVQSAGFEIIALDGARGQRLPVNFRTMHEPRLAVYDDTELTGASLRLVARKTGGAS